MTVSTRPNVIQISATEPDWSREQPRRFWDPGRKLLVSIRWHQRNKAKTGFYALLCCKIATLQHRFWSVITGADIPLNSQIGGGLLIPHPNGIVIHAAARIGPNCLIFQQVTIGTGNSSPPVIGGHVDIGTGAKILGNITIGDHVRIGANAVVLDDVESDATVVGIPARPVRP